jgi:hypothetical protein
MRASALTLLVLTPLLGCGTDPSQSANAVFPSQAFTGRDVRVEISGDQTSWSASTKVSFGPDVTVNSISVASPTDLFADVTISPTAAPGLVDVVVTDGGSTFTLSKAFEIDLPIAVTFQGLVAQGSISTLTIQNQDVENPFDTTSTTDILGNATFTNIALGGPKGMGFVVENVTPFQITALALTDVDAAASGDIVVQSGGSDVITSDAGSTTVAARTATALTAGTPTMGMVPTAFDSQLYSYTPTATAPDIEVLAVASNSMDASPAVAVLPASGHFADLLSFGPSSDTLNTTAGSVQYLVYWDNTGAAGYSYTLTQDDISLTHTTAIAGGATTPALATAITLPALGTGGDFKNASQWVKLTIAQGDVGKTLRLITEGDPTTDLQIDVFTSITDANTPGTQPFVECGDLGGNPVDCISPAITTTGTYYVELQGDPGFPTPTTDYILTAFLQ